MFLLAWNHPTGGLRRQTKKHRNICCCNLYGNKKVSRRLVVLENLYTFLVLLYRNWSLGAPATLLIRNIFTRQWYADSINFYSHVYYWIFLLSQQPDGNWNIGARCEVHRRRHHRGGHVGFLWLSGSVQEHFPPHEGDDRCQQEQENRNLYNLKLSIMFFNCLFF